MNARQLAPTAVDLLAASERAVGPVCALDGQPLRGWAAEQGRERL